MPWHSISVGNPFDMLVACGRVAVARAGARVGTSAAATAAAGDELARLAGDAHDWTPMFAAARSQGLLPIVSHELLDRCAGTLPSAVIAELRDAHRAAALQGLDAVRQLAQVVRALDGAGIPALPYKGPVLALEAYGDVGLRTVDDLDVVVAPSDVDRAAAALGAAGYAPASRAAWHEARAANAWHAQVALVRSGEPLPVELHWRYCTRKLPWNPDPARVLARAVMGDVAGVPVAVPTGEDQVVLVLLHAARHGWDRLEGIVCAGALVARGIDGVALCERAREVGGLRATLVGLEVARRLFHITLPGEVDAATGRDPAIPALADEANARLARGDAGATRDARLHLALLEGGAARARYLLVAAIDPTPQDRSAIALPRGARWLYFVIRPARLVVRVLLRTVR